MFQSRESAALHHNPYAYPSKSEKTVQDKENQFLDPNLGKRELPPPIDMLSLQQELPAVIRPGRAGPSWMRKQ